MLEGWEEGGGHAEKGALAGLLDGGPPSDTHCLNSGHACPAQGMGSAEIVEGEGSARRGAALFRTSESRDEALHGSASQLVRGRTYFAAPEVAEQRRELGRFSRCDAGLGSPLQPSSRTRCTSA